MNADDLAKRDKEVSRVERAISVVLRVGVLTSLTVVVAGLVITFLQHPSYVSSTALQHDVVKGRHVSIPHTVGQLVSGLAARQGTAIVALGLVVLLLTPVTRVAVSMVLFVLEHDRRYAVITAVVLSVLIASFFIGRATA